MNANTLITAIVAIIIVAFLIYQHQRDKKKQAAEDAAIAAKQAAWAIDWHNPVSPTYDPARVEAERIAFFEKFGINPPTP